MNRLVFTFLFLYSTQIFSQGFNLNAYLEFLQNNQNMTGEQLLQMNPAGTFVEDINQSYSDALFFPQIDSAYNLTEYEKELLQRHGFMVSERLKRISFGQAFLEIYHRDLPVFISTDAVLHAFHQSYSRIILTIEAGYLFNHLKELLAQAHSAMPQLHAKYAAYPEMDLMLKDVDFYLTVPRKLLTSNVNPYYSSNQERVTKFYNKAFAGVGMSYDTLFADACVSIDWSQFKPRGHYVTMEFPDLEKYFRAMMWLGRIELYLLKPEAYPSPGCLLQTFEDEKRQTIASFLIAEIFEMSNAAVKYQQMEEIIRFFVGDPDNVTMDNLTYLKNALQLQNANELLDNTKLLEFQDTLKQQSFAYQKILSQILISNPFSPDSIVPASAFMLFGQRFVIDSYVTGSVVFDRIKFNGTKVCRLFPKTLDPMFALGNNAAAQLLIEELEQYKYSTNLAALRYLIDSFEADFWESTIYNSWLNSIRKLNPPLERETLPMFMQTAAFWQEKLNTQLSSWTQLRHDNLLYAKQSYTGGSICSYPFTYIEPFPEFYNSLKNYSIRAKTQFQNLNFSNPLLKQSIIDYLQTMGGIMDTLESVSTKILNNTPFSAEETLFLKQVIYNQPSGSGATFFGWYPRLFFADFEHGDEGLMEKDHIVADIHTTPTNCGGGFYGWVTHVGTGSLDLGVFVADLPGNQKTAFIGPMLTHYEYVTTNFLRLTDQEWADQYLQAALRPEWVNLYLADSLGNSRGSGPTLITSVDRVDGGIIPLSELIINNYPNPFNPSTIISFTIPYDLTNRNAELKIYNVNGEVVRTLLNETLSSGNYLVKWDGTNETGKRVSSGVYFYSLNVSGKSAAGKMMLLK
jgi:hypothetical protein